jgi:plastocyanin
MGRRVFGGLAACTLILAVAGCDFGSSSSSSNASPSSSPAASATCPGSASPASGTSFTLTAADYCFSPSTFTLAVGQQVTIQFVNGGAKEHNLTIGDKDVGEADAGKTTSLTYTPSTGGTVQFFCKYHKTSNNMVGTATVTGGASSAPTTSSAPGGGAGNTKPAPPKPYNPPAPQNPPQNPNPYGY